MIPLQRGLVWKQKGSSSCHFMVYLKREKKNIFLIENITHNIVRKPTQHSRGDIALFSGLLATSIGFAFLRGSIAFQSLNLSLRLVPCGFHSKAGNVIVSFAYSVPYPRPLTVLKLSC